MKKERYCGINQKIFKETPSGWVTNPIERKSYYCLCSYLVWMFYKLNDKDVQLMADCNAGKITREEAESKLSRKY